jgi:hypothetical protein
MTEVTITVPSDHRGFMEEVLVGEMGAFAEPIAHTDDPDVALDQAASVEVLARALKALRAGEPICLQDEAERVLQWAWHWNGDRVSDNDVDSDKLHTIAARMEWLESIGARPREVTA